MAFKVLQVDHIGIGVNDLAATKEFYKNALGIEHLPEDEVVEEQKVKVSFFPCGDAELEFLETTTPDGPIGKFIEKNGGRDGIQHVALRVDNIENARLTREHNDANVLCLGAKDVDCEKAKAIIDIFLNTNFTEGRHINRVKKVMNIEKNEKK